MASVLVVGTRSQFGDLLQSPETLNEDGSIPEDADLYPMELSGSAQQGSNEYLALGYYYLSYSTS